MINNGDRRMHTMDWQFARVVAIIAETPRVKTFRLQLPVWTPHYPGQHYDIRLTAEDGYQAQRSYSVASAPKQSGQIDLTVDLIEEGEVSAYLHEGVQVGDDIEVRGPIGGYFIWTEAMKEMPLLLVAGGSGIVPLMSVLRHRADIGATNPATLLYSIRTCEDVIYQQELTLWASQDTSFTLALTYTRKPPPGWQGYQRRIDQVMLDELLHAFSGQPQCYVCGPSALVEQVANTLVDLGVSPEKVRTERFGPTGT